MTGETPYKSQPSSAFWKKVVAPVHPLAIEAWYTKKFSIDDGGIATAGSCFAQHIGRHLRSSGFNFVDTEPTPHWMSEQDAGKFGYGMYSARFGNVYSPRQLLQLISRAKGIRSQEEEYAWSFNGGYVDQFRPTIEPPLETEAQVLKSRQLHLSNVLAMFKSAKTFIFTLGLTETWVNAATGAAYPLCPGLKGGEFNSHVHTFANFNYQEIVADLEQFLAIYRGIRPDGQIIFTVSPVPLTATATKQQVVVATSYSKSVLRAAAGYLAETYPYVDYFPSYEIITSIPMRSMFFEPDMRSVNAFGVEHVMKQFFSEHRKAAAPATVTAAEETKVSRADVICDEMLLEMETAQ